MVSLTHNCGATAHAVAQCQQIILNADSGFVTEAEVLAAREKMHKILMQKASITLSLCRN